jgi:Ca-activated chloride channel family protein
MVFALALLSPVPRAYAMSFDDLWLRPDQQAARALAADDAKKAAEVARSPRWRGAAAYRGGDYASAATAFAETAKSADAAYNRGNALAKLGRYEDALAAYDEALGLAPDMADAAANRQAVEDWLKQQERQQQDNPQDSQQPSGSEPQSGDSSDAASGGDRSGQRPAGDARRPPGENSKSSEGESQAGDTEPTGSGNPNETPSPDGTRADEAGQDQAPRDDASGDSTNSQSKDPGSAENPAGPANPDDAGVQPSEEQQQALRRALDEQLANGEDPTGAGRAGEDQAGDDGDSQARAASPAETARSEQQQALEQWLERVPDDPGGLLRRKFLLEYQQRQRNGDDGE